MKKQFSKQNPRILKHNNKLVFLVFSLLLLFSYLAHFWLIFTTSVDIPYRDDWQLIDARISQSLPLTWLLSPHNEHPILTTKLTIWILYMLNSWNIKVHLVFNFITFGSIILLLFLLLHQHVPVKLQPLCCLTLFPLLSSLGWENHTWALQGSFHYCLLGILLAIKLLFNHKLSYWRITLGSISLLFAAFSLAAGVAAVAVILLLLGINSAYPNFSKTESASDRTNLFFVVLFVLGPILIWHSHFARAPVHSLPSISPFEWRFWQFFLNLVSFGFGFETYSALLGGFCFLMTLLPAALLLVCVTRSSKQFPWDLIALQCAVFALLAAISFGRGGHAEIEIWSKGVRYWEFAYLLVPITGILYGYLLQNSAQNFEKLFLLLLISCAYLGHSNNLDFSIYKWISSEKKKGVSCIEQHFHSGAPQICPSVWSENISEKSALAKRLGLFFIQ